MISPDSRSGVSGWPKILLRFEGAALLAAASFAYCRFGASWSKFALLFLIPHLSLLAYLSGPRIYRTAFGDAHLGRIAGGALFPPR